SGNTIYVESWISTSPYPTAIEIGVASGSAGQNATIEKNIIGRVYQNNTGGWGDHGIHLSAGNNIVVQNNLLFNLKNVGSASFSPTYTGGIRLLSGTGHKI